MSRLSDRIIAELRADLLELGKLHGTTRRWSELWKNAAAAHRQSNRRCREAFSLLAHKFMVCRRWSRLWKNAAEYYREKYLEAGEHMLWQDEQLAAALAEIERLRKEPTS